MYPQKQLQQEYFPLRKIKKEKKTSHLSVVIGDLHPASRKEKRVYDFWTFCHAVLWPTEVFTPQQEDEFKKLIREHFNNSGDVDATFKELVQRAVLAKRYIRRRSTRYISKPTDWLNIHFAKGLSGTAKWFAELMQQRKTVPHYNEGVTLLADAVLQFARNRIVLDVLKFREKLLEEKQFDLMFYYTNTVLHMQYIKY